MRRPVWIRHIFICRRWYLFKLSCRYVYFINWKHFKWFLHRLSCGHLFYRKWWSMLVLDLPCW